MKTYLLPLLLSTLASSSIAAGQGFEFPFEKPGVTITNKTGTNSALLHQETSLKVFFEKAIESYTKALESEKHPLRKTLGPLQSPVALSTLRKMNLTVMMLEKDDLLQSPTTWKLPSLGGSSTPFVTHIPYRFLKEATGDLRLEHLALHEVGHTIVGDEDKDDPNVEEVERERRVEYIIYRTVGKERYTAFMRQFMTDSDPNVTELGLKVRLENWMKFLGVGESDEKSAPFL